MCHVSGVRCHVYGVRCMIFLQSGGASGWRVCYQRGLPSLVFLWKDKCSVCAHSGVELALSQSTVVISCQQLRLELVCAQSGVEFACAQSCKRFVSAQSSVELACAQSDVKIVKVKGSNAQSSVEYSW